MEVFATMLPLILVISSVIELLIDVKMQSDLQMTITKFFLPSRRTESVVDFSVYKNRYF